MVEHRLREAGVEGSNPFTPTISTERHHPKTPIVAQLAPEKSDASSLRRFMKHLVRPIHPNNVKGFTLIELLVVIVLIGIIATMGVLNLTHWLAERDAHQEVKLLRKHIHAWADEAVTQQLTLAIKVNADHLKLYEQTQSGWRESPRHRKIIETSRGISLVLLNPDKPSSRLSDQDAKRDMIYLGSDGRVSPYTLRVQDQQFHCDLEGDLAGNIKLPDCQKIP